jgi:hypothetical protein
MTCSEYVEMNLIQQRLWLLEEKTKLISADQLSEYPSRDFTLTEIEDMSSFIDTLRTVGRVYG